MTKVDYSISAWGELRPPAIIIIHSTNTECCVLLQRVDGKIK